MLKVLMLTVAIVTVAVTILTHAVTYAVGGEGAYRLTVTAWPIGDTAQAQTFSYNRVTFQDLASCVEVKDRLVAFVAKLVDPDPAVKPDEPDTTVKSIAHDIAGIWMRLLQQTGGLIGMSLGCAVSEPAGRPA